MLDIGFPEFLLISFVLLIVVGPKDLPKVLRSITSFLRKIKSMASQFHSGIDDLANEAEISDLRNQIREKNAFFKVAKNTLARRAIKETNFEKLDAFLANICHEIMSHDGNRL